MLILITTAVTVFLGLAKALAVLIGAILGFSLFTLLFVGLLTLLVRAVIDGLTQAWNESSSSKRASCI